MKTFLTLLACSTLLFAKAQVVNISDDDLKHLITIGDAYARNVNATGADFKSTIEGARTPALNHICDVFIALNKQDTSIMAKRFLTRPGDDELELWYVIHDIVSNHAAGSKEKYVESADIAKKTLSFKTDAKWMLDNYYYVLHGGIAMAFNDADMSKMNIDIESLGLRNATEKAIFFLNIEYAMTQRFLVLKMMKNSKRLLEFAGNMPKFNGQPYYYYTSFSYDDFMWRGPDTTESYNNSHIGDLYSVLFAHFEALNDKGKKDELRDLYFKSIFTKPEYFRYSKNEADLQAIYNKTTAPH